MSYQSQPLNNFNPPPSAYNAFNNMFGQPEISPLGHKNSGSHFGYVQPLNPLSHNLGWHVTTDIGGLKQGIQIKHHDFLNDMNLG